MELTKNLRAALLSVSMLLPAAALAAPADQDSPLAGTGIEPNVVSYAVVEQYDDPLILLNRGIFAFNDVAYRFAFIPFARAYNTVLPSPVRTSVGNFFDNIKSPIPIVNHVLQRQGRKAMVEVARFGVNSTVGVLGLFDPATSWLELERQPTDFDDTLRQYNVGYGAYIVMPFAGPSNLRAGGSRFVDAILNPIVYVFNDNDATGLRIFDNVQEFTPRAEAYLDLRENSEDLYIFMRNAHLQGLQRDAEFK